MKVRNNSLSKFCGWKNIGTVFLFCALMASVSFAQTFTSLAGFNGPNGEQPLSTLVQGIDGSFYGTADLGGSINQKESYGTIFKITSAGVLTAHSMCNQAVCTQGLYPLGGLVLAADGNFYGTTANGGGNGAGDGDGTIFKITPGGTLTTLHSFANSDGMIPLDRWFKAATGPCYGTTSEGGIQGNGAVFKSHAHGRPYHAS